MTELNVVGTRQPPKGAAEKVTGATIYGTDLILPRMLHAKILRSPHAHARIISIDTSAAEKLPGVHSVVTAKDVPYTRFGLIYPDERFFAEDEVFYVGDEVAGVVAVDEETAEAAVKLIKVEYEPLPAVFDPVKALATDAPLARTDVESNVCHHFVTSRGDVEVGFAEAAVVHEETFILPHQYQAYIEPLAGAAAWEGERLTLWAPTQTPRMVATPVCRAFGISKGALRIIQTAIGGGFGGKCYQRIWVLVALLAKIAGHPVRLVYTREEDFQTSLPRTPMVIKLKMGMDSNGMITAKDMQIIGDNGAYSTLSPAIVDTAATRVDSLYRFKNLKVQVDLVYTNKIASGAKRGFGNIQAHFAVESMMDILAEKLNINAKDVRLRNASQLGDTTAHGWHISSCGLSESIEKAAQLAGWDKKRGQMQGKRRGIGMACGLHVSGNRVIAPDGDGAMAQIRVHEDGTVHVISSEGDIGQGANTVYAQIAAEELDVPYDRVFVDPLDTDVTYFGVGACASRVTTLGGHAVRTGAIAARERLIEAAAHRWDCDPDDVKLISGKLVNLRAEVNMEIAEAATHYIGMTGGSRLLGEGRFRAEDVVVPDKEKYGNISLAYAFATHVAEVEVDLETGHVTVLRLVAVHDPGRVINPIGAEGQVEGGLSQGMWFALGEEYLFNEGHVLNPNFTDYAVPTSLDVPEMIVDWVQTDEPNGPYGAKSLGEMALVPTPAAIANAIYDAVGVRLTQLPMTPERIFGGVKASQE